MKKSKFTAMQESVGDVALWLMLQQSVGDLAPARECGNARGVWSRMLQSVNVQRGSRSGGWEWWLVPMRAAGAKINSLFLHDYVHSRVRPGLLGALPKRALLGSLCCVLYVQRCRCSAAGSGGG